MSVSRRLAAIIVAIVIIQVAALLIYRRVERERRAPGYAPFEFEQLVPRQAPDFTFQRPDGSTHRLVELRGTVVLLHFWATWCPPCREELPRLLALGRSGRVKIVAVSLDKDWKVVREFFEGDIPSEVFRDAESVSIRAFDLSTLPDTYLVGPDGSMRLRFHGARDWGSDAARKVLESHAHSIRNRAPSRHRLPN